MNETIKILNENNISYNISDNKIYITDNFLNLYSKDLNGILDVSMIDNLLELYCEYNDLTKIICNEKLEKLNCSYNRISDIIYHEKLIELRCYCNPLNNFKVSEHLFNNCDVYSSILIYKYKYYYFYNKNRTMIIDITEENGSLIFKFKNTFNDDKIFKTYKNYILDCSNKMYENTSKGLIYQMFKNKIKL